MLVLNPRLTGFITDACPAWAEVFNIVAGRLVIGGAAALFGEYVALACGDVVECLA